MPATIEGNPPTATNVETPLLSLDIAVGDKQNGKLGIPMRSVWEIYGKPEVGKNTLTYYLCGLSGKRTIYTALEGVNVDYVSTAVRQGTVFFVSNKTEDDKPKPHSAMLQELATRMKTEEDVEAGILDSIGVLMPPAEEQGDYDDSAMGRRAQLVNKHLRDIESTLMLRESPANLYVLNHVYKGGMGQRLRPGVTIWQTPGGDGKEYIAAVRLHLWPKEILEEGVAYVSTGKVTKLRYGGKGRDFQFVILAGLGLSPELTALVDAVELGLAVRGATVKVLGQGGRKDVSLGQIGKLIQAAIEGDTDKFKPLFDTLNQYREEVRTLWAEEKRKRLARYGIPSSSTDDSSASRSRRSKRS